MKTNNECFLIGYNKAKNILNDNWRNVLDECLNSVNWSIDPDESIDHNFYNIYRYNLYDILIEKLSNLVNIYDNPALISDINDDFYNLDAWYSVKEGICTYIHIWCEDIRNINMMLEYFVNKYS